MARRRRAVAAGLALSLGAVSACSPRRVVERILLRDHFVLTTGLAYGGTERQRLDVYRPRSRHGPAPVIVFLYGGRWQGGSRDQYRLLGDALTRRGLVVVVPDYRLYPGARFPAWVEDAARAVRWVSDSIGRFGGDPSRIFVVGHSAGAHTAALLALDERYLAQGGLPRQTVRGIVSIAGPVATVWTDPDVQALMGPREGWPATYPLTHVDGREPPILLLHGGKDRTVAPANSVRLAERIRQRGGCARAIAYRGLDHVGIAIALSLPRLGGAPVLEDVLTFVADPAGGCGG